MRPPSDPECRPGQCERGGIGKHVPGIGDQRERPGEPAARRLDDHEPAGEEQHPEHAALAVGSRRPR